jgi:hypothetical protein
MFEPFRILLNTLFLNSPYIFEDGSRISYHAQFDILRFETRSGIPKILDIALKYDVHSRLLRIDTSRTWRWRDADVPLNMSSEVGPALTKIERQEVVQKLCFFQAKHPKKYEPLAGC